LAETRCGASAGRNRSESGVDSLAHGRSQNGVASLAYGRSENGVAPLAYGTPGHPSFPKKMDARIKSAHDDERCHESGKTLAERQWLR